MVADRRTNVFVQEYRRQGVVARIIATQRVGGQHGVLVCIDGQAPAVWRYVTSAEADGCYKARMISQAAQGWMRNGDPFTSSVKYPTGAIDADWVEMTVLPIVRRGPRPQRLTSAGPY